MLPKTFLIAILAAGISSVTCIRLKTAKGSRVLEWRKIEKKIDLKQEFDERGMEFPENGGTFWVGIPRPKDTETSIEQAREGLYFFEKESDADEFVRWNVARTEHVSNTWFAKNGFTLHDDRKGLVDPGEESPEPEGKSQSFVTEGRPGLKKQENRWKSEWKFACLRYFEEPDTDDEN